jgi:hypothetical protein
VRRLGQGGVDVFQEEAGLLAGAADHQHRAASERLVRRAEGERLTDADLARLDDDDTVSGVVEKVSLIVAHDLVEAQDAKRRVGQGGVAA